MAARKKAKKAKKARKKTSARKATARKKTARKKVVARKKPKAKARKAKARPSPAAKARAAAPRPAPAPARPPVLLPKPAAAAPPEERIGIVTHYYNHLSVAIVKLETGSLREGDVIHVKGHTSDFTQPVGSMEVEHVHVSEARPGDSFGLRVKEHAREHDVVYKVKR